MVKVVWWRVIIRSITEVLNILKHWCSVEWFWLNSLQVVSYSLDYTLSVVQSLYIHEISVFNNNNTQWGRERVESRADVCHAWVMFSYLCLAHSPYLQHKVKVVHLWHKNVSFLVSEGKLVESACHLSYRSNLLTVTNRPNVLYTMVKNMDKKVSVNLGCTVKPLLTGHPLYWNPLNT